MHTLSRRAALTLALVTLLLGTTTAATNRIVNGDFETAGGGPGSIPGWTSGSSLAFRAPMLGTAGSHAALLVGPATLRPVANVPVTPGETLTFSARVWEMRDDTDGRPGWRGDSVIALTFYQANGRSAGGERQWLCDTYVDLLDDDEIDSSDACTHLDGQVAIAIPQPAISCGHWECAMYAAPIVVPALAAYAVLELGGGLASDRLPITGLGANSATELAAFDDVFLGN